MGFSGISPKQTNSSHYIATLIKLKAQVSRFRTNPTFYLQHDNTPHCTPAWSQWFILHILAGLSEHVPNILFKVWHLLTFWSNENELHEQHFPDDYGHCWHKKWGLSPLMNIFMCSLLFIDSENALPIAVTLWAKSFVAKNLLSLFLL